MLWDWSEVYNTVDTVLQHDEGGVYSFIAIDIDFLTRYCLRLDQADVDDIMSNMIAYLNAWMPATARLLRKKGFDEILIVYPGVSKQELLPEVDMLRKKFRKQRFISAAIKNYRNVPITFSAGIASYPVDGDEPHEILRKTISALFYAKALRRNTVAVIPPAKEKSKNRVLWNPDLTVEVLIGNYGEIGFVKERVPYRQARLWEPQAIDADKHGNLYIVDQNNHAIIKCNGTETSLFAGNGSMGYSGDGYEAANAQLNKPTGLTIFEDYLYITDTGNDTVRRVHLKNRIIDTVAGNGEAGYTGDGSAATRARLNKPGSAAMDWEGNLYINDIANNVIRKVNAEGVIDTFAGSGAYGFDETGGNAKKASFREIYSIAIHRPSGDLYLADYFNHRIRKIDHESGFISTVAGTGQAGYHGDGDHALKAAFDRPVALHIDDKRNIFVAESGNSCIRYIEAGSNKAYTLIGDGICGIGHSTNVERFRFANPNGVVLANGNLFILDGANNRVCRISI